MTSWRKSKDISINSCEICYTRGIILYIFVEHCVNLHIYENKVVHYIIPFLFLSLG